MCASLTSRSPSIWEARVVTHSRNVLPAMGRYLRKGWKNDIRTPRKRRLANSVPVKARIAKVQSAWEIGAMPPPKVFLKPRKAQPFYARHPWVLDTAVDRVEGEP